MQHSQFEQARKLYRTELERTVDFWLTHGVDRENGGIDTCLDRSGARYSTDKSVWMQGRCAWTFGRLCSQYGVQDAWLELTRSCVDFLDRHCTNPENGRLYFTVTGDGRPLRQRRYYFSETFSIMAHAAYFFVSGDRMALERARALYDLVWRLYCDPTSDPVQMPPKTCPQTRQNMALGPHMILLNVCQTMGRCDTQNNARYAADARVCLNHILTLHKKDDLQAVLEHVGPNGAVEDWHCAGRQINPGHTLECCWFLLDCAKWLDAPELLAQAEQMFAWALARGWDKTYGGILYFVDLLDRPPEAYEHDMKLWWPHNEAIIASLKLFEATGARTYYDWFERLTQYAFSHFSDPQYGEWFGYLRRDGEPTQPACKGSLYKGPFHLLRMLMTVDEILGRL